jgi:hypothetical protein
MSHCHIVSDSSGFSVLTYGAADSCSVPSYSSRQQSPTECVRDCLENSTLLGKPLAQETKKILLGWSAAVEE